MDAFLNPDSKAPMLLADTRVDFLDGCMTHQDTRALAHTIQSNKWKPHWKEMRALTGPNFNENFTDAWSWFNDGPGDWRRRLWERNALSGPGRVANAATTSEEFVGGQSQTVARSHRGHDKGARVGAVS